jgi:hypothetical protein
MSALLSIEVYRMIIRFRCSRGLKPAFTMASEQAQAKTCAYISFLGLSGVSY